VHTALEAVDDRTPLALAAGLEYADAAGAGHFAEHKAALAAAERALVRYRALGDRRGIAHAQHLVAASLVILERPAEAEPLLREALETARTLGDGRLAATVLRIFGHARTERGDFAGARASLTEALGLAKAVGAEFLAASIAASIASNEYDAGKPEMALSITIGVLESYRALNSSTVTIGIVTTFADMAKYLIALGRYDEARVYAKEALALASGLRYIVLVAITLQQLAAVALLKPPVDDQPTSSKYAAIARLFGFVDARFTELSVPEKYGLTEEYAHALALLRAAIGMDESTQLIAAGALMTENEAMEQARAIH
jgi:tetratricopeptide (TPR) repeat protein